MALRVLLVEDNPSDAFLVREYLAEDSEVHHVTSLAEAKSALARIEPDVVLSDLRLPDSSGLDTFEALHGWYPDVPIVILSGLDDKHMAVEAVRRGAQDYLPKDELTGNVLPRMLRYAFERSRAERKLAAKERRWRAMIQHNSDIIVLIDEELRVHYVSDSVTKHTDFEPAELQGQQMSAYIHSEDQEDVRNAMSQALGGEHGPTVSLRFRHKHGGWRWMEAASTNLMTDPAVGAIVVNVRDVTERKQGEQDRKALLLTLGERVKELKVLHEVSLILQDEHADLSTIFERLVETMPSAWRFPNLTAAEVTYEHADRVLAVRSPGFRESAWMQRADFATSPHGAGTVRIAHLGEHPQVETESPFLDKEQALIESLAQMLRAFLERRHAVAKNASLTANLSAQVSRLGALQKIAEAILSTSDLEQTLAVIVDQATRELKCDAADVLLFDAATQTLGFAAGKGFQTSVANKTRLRLGEGMAGRAALTRKPLRMTDVSAPEVEFSPPDLLEIEGFCSYYAVPLIAKDHLQGVLGLFHRRPLEFTEEWRDVAADIGRQAAIAIDDAHLLEDLQRSNSDLQLSYERTIEGWARALDLKDEETAGHSRRVTELTVQLARKLGITGEDLGNIRRGALLHDIGKMGVPDKILLKPGKLDPDEWKIMQQHTTHARDLLVGIPFLQRALDIPYAHHEKWNGDGYPRGLQGAEIPLPARIFAVVDVFDALINNRPYRRAWSRSSACEYIAEQSGEHFDPRVVEAFFELREETEGVSC